MLGGQTPTPETCVVTLPVSETLDDLCCIVAGFHYYNTKHQTREMDGLALPQQIAVYSLYVDALLVTLTGRWRRLQRALKGDDSTFVTFIFNPHVLKTFSRTLLTTGEGR